MQGFVLVWLEPARLECIAAREIVLVKKLDLLLVLKVKSRLIRSTVTPGYNEVEPVLGRIRYVEGFYSEVLR